MTKERHHRQHEGWLLLHFYAEAMSWEQSMRQMRQHLAQHHGKGVVWAGVLVL